MIQLGLYEIFEIIFGIFFIWLSFYILTRNPSNTLSWIVFGFLFGFSIVISTEPILIYSRTVEEYVKWQNMTDWPLFLSPIFCYHTSLLVKRSRNKLDNYLLFVGYAGGILFTLLDIHGGYILREDIQRLPDFRTFDGFAPGVMLIPSIGFEILFLILAAIYFYRETSRNFWKFFLPFIGCLIYIIGAVVIGTAYFTLIPNSNMIFTAIFATGLVAFVYSIVRYHLFSPSEKLIFDRTFFYRTIGIIFIFALYLLAVKLSGLSLTYPTLVLVVLLTILVFFTHTFYEWLITFSNDLAYNSSSGFSIVTDNEIYQAIKNFNQPENLENSILLELKIIGKKLRKEDSTTPVDSLRKSIKEAIEYFKPDESNSKRNKKNLKYELLRMLTFDEAEEGQILWELGFDEYPVRIMAKERNLRAPMFKIESPSDYSYTSRNAYLALKKEAIHDVTWRISYLEKLSKKRII